MFSKVMLFVISAFVIGVVVAGFVFSQTGVSFSNTPPSGAWHSADQIWCSGCVSSSSLADNSVTTSKIASGEVTSADILDNTIGAVDVTSEICTQSTGCTSGTNACSFLVDTESFSQGQNGVAVDIPAKCLQGTSSPSASSIGVSFGTCKVLAIMTGGNNPRGIFTIDYSQGNYGSSTPRWTATVSHEFTSTTVSGFHDPSSYIPAVTRSAIHSLSASNIGQIHTIFFPVEGIGLGLFDSYPAIENVADKWSVFDGDSQYSLQLYVC